ncbi:SRPBCC domain-containing protein [Streptomyces avicenniae]|uniref:SRPBCC domain-containing protein n=1 Tax=Streptomyces avicenniae TaxID=500153 RepID=UPI00069CAEB3|nr:SRPBCC domain-containing protein [Streptomyces avicenniae]
MPLPDRIERTLDLAHPIEKVWAALTTTEGLGGWLGDTAEIDELRPGGRIRARWDGTWSVLRIETVEPPRRLSFTWPIDGLPPRDPRRTRVEITLDALGDGTRLSLTETGFAQLPAELDAAYRGNAEGWQVELAKLARHLDARG